MKDQKKRAERILRELRTGSSAFWERVGKSTALRVSKSAVRDIPAYRDFVKAKKISTWKDFEALPIIDKKTFLRKYPLEKLTRTALAGTIVYSSTSGSTGKPFYFPRNDVIDWQYSVILESFLQSASPNYAKQRTLVIVGFGMGVWIGGVIAYRAFEYIGERIGGHISIITPGINKKEILNSLRDLSPQYDQTILIGYAPFTKDILDEAEEEGIPLKKLHLKLLFAAEAFTEAFRDYLVAKTGIRNPCNETLNTYGTSDIGAVASETPVSIFLRRLIFSKPGAAERVFGKIERTPTLAQYNPHFIHFESIGGELVFTGDSELPLVRYAIGDHGGVYSFTEMQEMLRPFGIDIRREAQKHGLPVYELPFVYVYERTDMSTTLYGLQVYPETIRNVLIEDRFQNVLTGKFTLMTIFDKRKDQHLEIHIEQKRNRKIGKSEALALRAAIVAALRRHNSEFRELSDYLGKRATPVLRFWGVGEPPYFVPGVKQKWVKKA